jgi:hypothetical protein
MKHPFKLSKTNIFYFVIVCLIFIAQHLLTARIDAEFIGYVFGIVVGLFTIPFLIGLLFWYIQGKKERGGTTAFNVMLTIVALSQLNLIVQENISKNREKLNVKQAIKEYKEELLTEPDSINAAYEKLFGKLNNGIDDLIEKSYGTEKNTLLVVKEFLLKTDSISTKWNSAHSEIINDRFFDVNLLKDKKECESQIILMNNFIEVTKEYRFFLFNREPIARKMFEKANAKEEVIKSYIQIIKNKEKLQKPYLIPYFESFIKYGEKMNLVLNILKNNKWTYSNDNRVEFKNEEKQIEFQQIIDEISIIEDKVNSLQEKLIEVM